MRFITEFEMTPELHKRRANPNIAEHIKTWKERGQLKLGEMIPESFGWTESLVDLKVRYTVEIEAFPMDKWVEFKKKLASQFVNDSYAGDGFTEVFELIKELESFGKPSGDAITNQQLNNK